MKPQIWIDADACPKIIKETIFNLSARLQIQVNLVANSPMFIPQSSIIKLIIVKSGADVADQYIVEHLSANDIVVTSDIPLAAFVVEKNAIAINIRGEIYTEENVREKLSMRDFMKDLRDSTGMNIGGPIPFNAKDKEKFTNSLNQILQKKLSSLKHLVQE